MAGIRNSGLMAWLYMMRVVNRMERKTMEHLAEYNLTPAQFDVLAHLSVHSGISQQALSERLLVTKGNVCGLIDRLEDRGLVVRYGDPDDGRLRLLRLTEEGKALAQQVVPLQEELIREHMSNLSDSEQRTLHVLLRRLDQSLS